MIVHRGHTIPQANSVWDPDSQNWVCVCWEAYLDGRGILSSEWILPVGWTELSTLMDETTVVNGETLKHVNMIMLSTRQPKGTFVITNRVKLDDGVSVDRSLKIIVEDT